MADIDLVVADRVSLVEAIGHGRQRTLIASEGIVAGAPVYIVAATGKWARGDGSGAATARIYGVALKTVLTGEPLTAVKVGTLGGYDLDALDYDAPVYLSDTVGRLGDTAGTVSLVVGRVVPANAVSIGTAPDKLLEVNL